MTNNDFSAKPYFDDFNEQKGFHKILFKPGFSVQARELNQLQTILQDQISKFGSHVFKNGSMVIPGAPKLDTNAKYVILEDNNTDPTILTKLVGKTLYQTIAGQDLKATVKMAEMLGSKVLAIVSYQNSVTDTILGQVENISSFGAGAIYVVDDLTFDLAVATAGPSAEPSTGRAITSTVPAGVFFVDGYFVYTDTQSILVSWNMATLSKKIGFEIIKSIITSYDDSSLYDNALGSPNEGAPGADRFAIELKLTALPLTDDVTDFIEISRFENGSLKVNKQFSQYNVLDDTFARRTYDESGDYAVRGFDLKVIDHLKDERNIGGFLTEADGGDDNLFALEITDGKAYVKGYEVENLSNLYMTPNKARTIESTKVINDVIQYNNYGSFIYLAPGNRFIDISRHPIIWLTNGVENTATIIGYCIPKHMEAFSISGQTIFRLYGTFTLSQSVTYGWNSLGGWMLDINHNGPVLQVARLTDVVSTFNVVDGLPLTSHAGYTPYAWDASNKDLYLKKALTAPVFNTSLQVVKGAGSGYVTNMTFTKEFDKGPGDLIKLNTSNIKTIKDALGNVELQATVGYTCTITTNASGYGELNYIGDGVFTGNPVAAHTSIDNSYFANIVTITNAGKRLVINNATYPNAVFSVSAALSKNLSVKTKTLAEAQTIFDTPSGGKMVLGHKDVYKLKAVYMSANLSTVPTTADTNVTQYYELVNNDTLDFYQNTILKPKAGASTASGRLLVVYDRFLQGPGDCYSVDSYAALKDSPGDNEDTTHIGRIPIFKVRNTSYVLSDYLDFRQTPRDGFFIIKGTCVHGSAVINVSEDYRAVITVGSKIFCKGFAPTGITVASITGTTITASAVSEFGGAGTYSVHLIVSPPGASQGSEPFNETDLRVWSAMSGQSMTYDATYFVDRWDRVVIFKDGNIKYIYGVPGITRYPEVPLDAMSLGTLKVPAYTRTAASIKYAKDDNRRYTMRDIGKLERRIENLEYYTTLTLKEMETKDLKIIDADTGLDRFKCGLFVSDFRDFGVFSPFDGGFQSTLVPTEQKAIPLEFTDSIGLNFNEVSSTNFVVKGTKVMLPYTHQVEINQPFATDSESINPYLIIAWNAQMTLNPATDYWVETEWAPTLTNVSNLSNTVINEATVFNDSTVNTTSGRELSTFNTWSAPAQVEVTSNTQEVSRNTGTSLASANTSTNVSSSSREIGSSVIPIMRSKTIRFTVTGSKPNTRYWPTFDAVDVSSLCRPVNPTTMIAGTYGQEIISDAMGMLVGDFQLPPNTFTTGTKTFTIADINLIMFPDAGTECIANANYTSNGVLRTMQEVVDIVNTTTVVYNQVTTVNRVTTINTDTTTFVPITPAAPVTIDVGVGPVIPGEVFGGDPLAQSFDTYNIGASGMFVTKIDLYFEKKDYSEPVFVEIRDLVNGYPARRRIPGSLVGLAPESVNVSANSTVPTTFEFDEPIFLEANKEFAFVVWANTSRYWLWISRMGEKVVNEDRIVGEQPHMGSLFKSQNSATWTPFQLEDLKFRIHRAKFNTNVAADFIFENNGDASRRRVPISGFSTTSGSKFITITHPNHGMAVNEQVIIEAESAIGKSALSPNDAAVFNGIPMSEIYGTKVVKSVISINKYTIEVTTSATATKSFEDIGRYVFIKSNVNYYAMRMLVDEFQPTDTAIKYFANAITGKDFDGGQTAKVNISEFQIKNQDTNLMSDVGLVQLSINETSKSLSFRASASTNNEYLSPVVRKENNSAIVASLCLNKPVTENESDAVQANGAVSSKMITQVITLKTAASSLRVYTTESKQDTTDIELYFRTAINKDIETKMWTLLAPTATAISATNEDFIEHERKIDGLVDFDEFQIKVLFKGVDSVRHPSLKELRTIAVAT